MVGAMFLVSRAFYLALALAVLAVLRTPFDASAPPADPFVRWDALHFRAIARDHYRWEHQYAFLPAISLLYRRLGPLLLFLCNTALAYDSTLTLYQLSLHHLRRKDLARLATLLALIPSSPPTLYWAPYAEPFFTHLSYRGTSRPRCRPQTLISSRHARLGA